MYNIKYEKKNKDKFKYLYFIAMLGKYNANRSLKRFRIFQVQHSRYIREENICVDLQIKMHSR